MWIFIEDLHNGLWGIFFEGDFMPTVKGDKTVPKPILDFSNEETKKNGKKLQRIKYLILWLQF